MIFMSGAHAKHNNEAALVKAVDAGCQVKTSSTDCNPLIFNPNTVHVQLWLGSRDCSLVPRARYVVVQITRSLTHRATGSFSTISLNNEFNRASLLSSVKLLPLPCRWRSHRTQSQGWLFASTLHKPPTVAVICVANCNYQACVCASKCVHVLVQNPIFPWKWKDQQGWTSQMCLPPLKAITRSNLFIWV